MAEHKVCAPLEHTIQLLLSSFCAYPFKAQLLKLLHFAIQASPTIFTARHYASAVLAVIMCLSVCPSVCHKSELYKDG